MNRSHGRGKRKRAAASVIVERDDLSQKADLTAFSSRWFTVAFSLVYRATCHTGGGFGSLRSRTDAAARVSRCGAYQGDGRTKIKDRHSGQAGKAVPNNIHKNP
jgi:hypothetical protein